MRRPTVLLIGAIVTSAVLASTPALAKGWRGGGDRDFDHDGLHGGYVVRGYYGPFWPGWGWSGVGHGWWAPWGGVYGSAPEGDLRLNITGPEPKQAEVYADGAFVGTVNKFNGTFHHLTLPPGPHRIEVRAKGYRPLDFAIQVQPDKTLTYRADMRKAP